MYFFREVHFYFFYYSIINKSVIQSEDNIGFISTVITSDFEPFINFLQQLQMIHLICQQFI